MRGTKDEEKLKNPMFPRLHVNDTEKGGPRAPPRNKMALYEQFSIPSQRFAARSASVLPIWPSNSNNFTPMSSGHDMTALRNDVTESGLGIGKGNASNLRSNSCSRPSLGGDCRSHKGLINGSQSCEDKRCGSVQVAERHDHASDTCTAESIQALNVSPDDVVGLMGEKLFWKVRRAILNQQRVFSVQVFELHRLIKVQRLIAGSPELLVEANLCLAKQSIKVSPVKKLVSEYVPEPPAPPNIRSNDSCLMSNPSIEYAHENAVGKFPLPVENKDSGKGLVTQQSNSGLHSPNPPVAAVATNTKPSLWCFHPPPGNQWLVPAMSPSEGLVYKPYTGSGLPTSGFMAPALGNCGPVSPGSRDFLNTVYGVPASPQGFGILPGTVPLGQTYVPLYGMPVINQSPSSSAVEQMNQFAAAQTNGPDHQFFTRDINFGIPPQQSSCNMPGEVARVISPPVGKSHVSQESELQGSTASCPAGRAKADALPLFPTTPTVQALDRNVQNSEPRIKVIKVVPHNPRSATESAFRIFRSIQEERKQI